MTIGQTRAALAVIFVLGLVARVWAWRHEPGIHADEYFQMLEPPYWRLTGTGLKTWEWYDGLRSWALPGYHGAWMALLMKCGVTRGATIAAVLQLHWAFISNLIVLIAFRGGCLIARRLLALPSQRPRSSRGVRAETDEHQGGLWAASLCAVFPVLIAYASHTLSEIPALLAYVAGLVMAVDCVQQREPAGAHHWGDRLRAAVSGFLLSLAVCFKIAHAPLALVGPSILLGPWLTPRPLPLRARFVRLGWMAVGATLPIGLFGLLDLFTWGTFLGSFVKYLKFNLIEGGAANFGVAPWHWYLARLASRVPHAWALLVAVALVGWRATWPYLLAATGLVTLLSTQPHKEERFVVVVWPLLLIAAGGTAGAWLTRRLQAQHRSKAAVSAAAAWAVAVTGSGSMAADAIVNGSHRDDIIKRGVLRGQIDAADDHGAIVLMADSVFATGGALWYSGRGPVLQFDAALLGNGVITHVLVGAGSDHERQAQQAGFVRLSERDGVALLQRQPD